MLTDASLAPCHDDLRLAPRDPESAQADEALLRGLLAGQDGAWRELDRRHGALIRRCICRVTSRFRSVVSEDDVEEIHADLVCALLANDMHKLRQFDPERRSKLSSFLGMLATNAAWDHLRRRKRESRRTSDVEAEVLPARDPDAFDVCSHREEAAHVDAILADFTSKDQELIELTFADGLEPDEVASRMGISVKTVYTKKFKIRRRLEALLAA